MTTTYGLQVFDASGIKQLDSTTDIGGRVYLGRVDFSALNRQVGDVIVSDIYPVEKKEDLFVYVASEGPFTYTIQTILINSTSRAQIVATVTRGVSAEGDAIGDRLILLVFAKKAKPFTSINNYGLYITNPNSELVLTDKALIPTFLERVTPNPFYGSNTIYQYFGFNNYRRILFAHTVNLSQATNKDRLIFMTIPDITIPGTTDKLDVWYWVDSFADGLTNESSITVYVDSPAEKYFEPDPASETKWIAYGPTKAYPLPQIYVFALDYLPSSGQTYGLQIKNSTGGITFDSGLKHLNIDAYIPNLTFTDTKTAVSGFTQSETKAIVIPKYAERRSSQQGADTWIVGYAGAFQRDGSTLYTKLIPYSLEVIPGPPPPPPPTLPITVSSSTPSVVLENLTAVIPFKPVTAANGTTPYTYSISPEVPAGLFFDTGTGYINGTPTTLQGATQYTVTVAGGTSGSATFTIEIKQTVTEVAVVNDETVYGCPDPMEPILISPGISIPAQDLKIGHLVWTRGENDILFNYHRVKNKEYTQQEKILIKFVSGLELIVSDSHMFWYQGRYLSTSWLVPNTELQRVGSGTEVIKEKISLGIGTVVKIEIEYAHTYVVNGFLSHNVKIYEGLDRPGGFTAWQ